jgi:hypothetical protein
MPSMWRSSIVDIPSRSLYPHTHLTHPYVALPQTTHGRKSMGLHVDMHAHGWL